MSRDSALVSADWAEKNLGAAGIVFVEVDEDTAAYDAAHIPGAVKLDWSQDLQDPVRRDFVNKQQFEALLSARGIGNDDIVVLYGGNNNWFAAYAYWYFKLYGHATSSCSTAAARSGSWTTVRSSPMRSAGRPPATPPAEQDRVDPRLPRRGGRRDRGQEPGRRALARRVRRSPARPGPPAAGAGAAGRPHPDRAVGAVVEGGQRGRHLQVRRRAARRSTARPAWTGRRRPSPTAVSASAPRTPGSCCRSCSASPMSRTTTVRGPSTARWSVCRWRSATSPVRRRGTREYDQCDRVRRARAGCADPGQRRPREGDRDHRLRADRRRRAGRRAPTSGCSTAPASSPPRW